MLRQEAFDTSTPAAVRGFACYGTGLVRCRHERVRLSSHCQDTYVRHLAKIQWMLVFRMHEVARLTPPSPLKPLLGCSRSVDDGVPCVLHVPSLTNDAHLKGTGTPTCTACCGRSS